ncbi:hypothetical protein INR49_031521 [Caranx melampygus]|nr:hypothetical protein INR49_031521 [Caranx melampygus]
MFDHKKRYSVAVNCSREAEEFRRVAVRRKVQHDAVDCQASQTVPPKPALLRHPVSAGQVQAHNPTTGKRKTEEDQSPNRRTSSPVLGSPSPGKGSIQNCSPLREGGHSPAKLFPSIHSPLSGKLRTPSPVMGRKGSYSPARNSKSWLGLHKIPSSKMEGQEKRTRKSLSVPDLVVYIDENRIPTETAERCPLKPLQSPNCTGPAITIKAPVNQRLSYTTNETHQFNNGRECAPGQNGVVQEKEWPVGNENGINEDGEQKQFSCQCTEASTEDGRTDEEPVGEQNEEDKRKERGESNPKDIEKKEQKLYNIANELLQTERAYVARLHLLDQVFCTRLAEEAARGSFPPEVIRNIFSNISSIYSFHSKFLLPDLETCISRWCERPGLGGVLLQHAPFLRMYADYVRNFDHAAELVRTWTERSAAFRNIIQDIESQEVCSNLTLQHHMLEPVQRVPRYEMLLGDYLKKLPQDNPDYESAQKSLQTISLAATHSNTAIHKAESLKRLLEIYEMIGDEEVVNPTNELLREGRLLKLAARNTSAMERHLFLFNNFLLCCTSKFSLVGQRFTVRCRIGVDGMQVQQTTNEDHPHTFQVSGKERTLELQASSEQDRDEWIKVIQGAIDVFQKKNKTFKLASKELSVEEPVVCWKCSDYKVALEYDGNKPNKVCKTCYLILTGQRGGRGDGRKRTILEREASREPSDIIMSGFLQYGDNSKTCQRLWCVIKRTESPVLFLYAAPHGVKPLSTVPLAGCSVEDSPQDGHPCFCLGQSKTTHTFFCDSLDLKERWLTVLKVTVTGTMPADTLTGSDITTNGTGCGINDNASDESVSSGEESNINGNKDNNS